MGWQIKRYRKRRKTGRQGQRDPRMALYFYDEVGTRTRDPEDEEGFTELEDPEDEEGFTELEDPEDEEGFTELEDPEDEEGFTELEDPEDEEGFTELEDPEDEEGFTELEDPTTSYRRARRRLKKSAALWGDYPSGRPGNVPRSTKTEYSGSIIIRLAPEYAYEPFQTLDELAHTLNLKGLGQALEIYEVSASRLVRQLSGDPEAGEPVGARKGQKAYSRMEDEPLGELRYLEELAAENGLPPIRSLGAYWRAQADHLDRTRKRALLSELNALPEVDRAYRELKAMDPAYSNDAFFGAQGYLEAAPDGIDARWAEQIVGTPSQLGKGVTLVDLEQGWMPKHPDFKGKKMEPLVFGDNRHGEGEYLGHHGTAVLGEIAAQSDGAGVIGVAPGATVKMASHFDSASQTNGHVAAAIYAVIHDLTQRGQSPSSGDVLLIEVQRNYLPTEVDDADFDAIRLASGVGIVVVEAAGNGSANLDKVRRGKKGARIFNRRSRAFRESGAIMVGAAFSSRPHRRKRSSNYGSRLDCFAWGNRVVTCGYGDLYDDGSGHTYTADFSNTSAAAPIIAGAAAIIQGLYRSATGKAYLQPSQMRALLADPATGTRQGRGAHGHIGVMPNLQAIVRHRLRIVPDVYLRDDIAGTGELPMAHRVGKSPDILIAQSTDPDFGEGSGTENSLTAGSRCVAGTENFVFVRMRNRGLRHAEKVAATVYWSEPTTLVNPDRWREMGCATTSVAQGDLLELAGPIEWPGQLSTAGNYCLIALLENTQDPVPLPPGQTLAEGAWQRHFRSNKRRFRPIIPPPFDFDWLAYLAYLRSHNQIAWRNFHIVDASGYSHSPTQLNFKITGTPAGDRGRIFDLEVLQRLPEGARLSLDVPMTLAPALSIGGPWKPEVVEASQEKHKRLRFQLPPLPCLPLVGVPLAAGAAHGCCLNVSGGDELTPGGHSVAIRQLFRGREVGRITWQFSSRTWS